MEIKTDNFLISMDNNNNYASIQAELSQHAIDVLYQLISIGVDSQDEDTFSLKGCEIELGFSLINEFNNPVEYKLVSTLFHLFFYDYKGCIYMDTDDEVFIRVRRG
ncbi:MULTISPECIES: hypothetical protein [Staphylococcus]|nr:MULTISPECIES: hypothetical protein [Staphylococcus]MCE5034985.1 hypothetical protein [Staphylococcus cohnii]OEK76104.1 hypothetical protein AST06_00650 [Staphylococcus saprophyticus]PTF18964.1 hypothetical protein BUY40_09530 [Staphylococcus cohnii]PTF24800.1 hypothetical protein BUY31_06760 [Staphylococcus cohnii]PTF25368.1 hypothetical protein BUY30_03370 [Staphylococcus cohnii]